MIKWGSELKDVRSFAPLLRREFRLTFSKDGQPIIRWGLEQAEIYRRPSAPLSRRRYSRVHRWSYKLDKALYALGESIIEDRYRWVGWAAVGLVGAILVAYVIVAAVRWGWPA